MIIIYQDSIKEIDASNVAGFHIHKLRIDTNKEYSSFKICVGRNTELFETLLHDKFLAEERNIP